MMGGGELVEMRTIDSNIIPKISTLVFLGVFGVYI